jgi:hypothetical protein
MTAITDSATAVGEEPAPVTTRRQLAGFMRSLASSLGAAHFALVEPSNGRGTRAVRVLSSNWMFDALEDLGEEGLAAIVESGMAYCAGARPVVIDIGTADFLSRQQRDALLAHGHQGIYCQKVVARGNTVFALYTAAGTRKLDARLLARAHMRCRYALDQYFVAHGAVAKPSVLSDRERECLNWVSRRTRSTATSPMQSRRSAPATGLWRSRPPSEAA